MGTSSEEKRKKQRAAWLLPPDLLVSPCWSRGSPGRTGPAWRPALCPCPRRNTGRRARRRPGPGASPAATSWERWGLRGAEAGHPPPPPPDTTLASLRSLLTLVGALLGAEPALGVHQLPAGRALLAAVGGAAGGHQGEKVPLGPPEAWEGSAACGSGKVRRWTEGWKRRQRRGGDLPSLRSLWCRETWYLRG